MKLVKAMKRMLVLYRELAGYFVNSMNHLADAYNVEINIVAYPVQNDAPFRFEFSKNIQVHNRFDCSIESLNALGEFDLIFCGGWSDKLYLQYVKGNQHVPALIGFDKQWLGSLRDVLGAAYLRYAVSPLFKYAFVPGLEQEKFALKMGFEKPNIYSGAYTCNTEEYAKVFENKSRYQSEKRKVFYAGRYAPEKGIMDLWETFTQISEDFPQWELHCIGTGPLANNAIKHPRIIHHGFLQGEEMYSIMATGELFVLPSTYEPWGVVVNEFATSGYPLILSDRVGARTGLLTEKNGWIFQHGNKQDLAKVLRIAMSMSAEQLKERGAESHRLGSRLNVEQYAKAILQMMASS